MFDVDRMLENPPRPIPEILREQLISEIAYLQEEVDSVSSTDYPVFNIEKATLKELVYHRWVVRIRLALSLLQPRYAKKKINKVSFKKNTNSTRT